MEPEPPWELFVVVAVAVVGIVAVRVRAWRHQRDDRSRSRSRSRFRMSGVRRSTTLLSLGSAVVMAMMASDRWALSLPIAWLVGVNVASILWFGLDKAASMISVRRVPESTLHTMAALGGSPGALVGMDLFRHKTIKPSFNKTMGRVVLVQVVAVLIYLRMRNGT